MLTLFSVEIALTLGVIFFALSLIRRKPIITLPPRARRLVLQQLGIAGPLFVLAVATATNWLSMTDSLIRIGGWWQRPAPLLAASLVVLVASLTLRSTPLPAPGERAISPRQRWWAFVPRTTLTVAVVVSVILFLTLAWHTAIGVSMPDGANRYGVGPYDNDGLPGFMTMQGGMGYVWGAGWPNHLATLLTFAAVTVAVILALGSDANRPFFARASAAEVREERAATAHMITLIALGGLLLTLGAVWAHIGFVGEISVSVYEDTLPSEVPDQYTVGTGYGDFAQLIHRGGYVVQGIGAALLLRVLYDTLRAAFATRTSRKSGHEETIVESAVESTSGASK